MESFDLETYLTEGVMTLLSDAARAALNNPREAAFLARFSGAAQRAARRRAKAAAQGGHVPSFLIASITGQCNLSCAGCYARANGGCGGSAQDDMTAAQWGRIFDEAAELGVSLVLLAGGEPMLRDDVLQEAARRTELLFPVFTNGTLFGEAAVERFDRHRNLVPMLSLEGDAARTDRRRGGGVMARLEAGMAALADRGVLYGVSVTVTRENIAEVTGGAFVESLRAKGCRVVLYVEYVSADGTSQALAPGEAERALLDDRLAQLRGEMRDIIFVSFPGDEKLSGGCLAAGRGFFHINATGGAEPCPFSPYSDTSVRDRPLREALDSPLFRQLRGSELLEMGHDGACALFTHEAAVRSLVKATQQI